MDGFNEKKWFVYLGDHHEGPFSLADIQNKIAQSQVTTANFVWAEGMTDWKPMTAVPEFEALLTPGSGGEISQSPELAAPEPIATEVPVLSESPSLVSETVLQPLETATPTSSTLQTTTPMSAATPPSESTYRADLTGPSIEIDPTSLSKKTRRPRPPASRSFKGIVFVLLAGAFVAALMSGTLDPVLRSPSVKATLQAISSFAQPQLLKLSEKIPALGKWVSPIPALEDVTPEDYDELKQAAMQRLDKGPRIAISVSTADLFAPSFYVASNLPDGTVIDVYLEGSPDTLLNQLSFSGKTQATIDKKLGVSGKVRFGEGKPLPRGEYVAYATEGAQQPDAVHAILGSVPPVAAKVPAALPVGLRLLASKPMFLGGVKDTTYASRLKEFHDKLREKATAELAETKQLSITIESQLTASSAKFAQLRKLVRGAKIPPAARKGWHEFNTQWSKLEQELRTSYDKWTDEALASEYFYGMLYSLTKAAGDAVGKLHQMQTDFFEGKVDPKAFEIQRGSAVSVAESAVVALKNKISQAENLAPTPNGMPRREGL
jgi:hypothetical protein